MMAKLSKNQQDLLDAMKNGEAILFVPYMGRFNPTDYYYRSSDGVRVTAAAKALIQKGYAANIYVNVRRSELRLTDKAQSQQ